MAELNRSEVLEALQKCLIQEPTINYCLSRDASSIAAVLAEMNFYHQDSRALTSLSDKQKTAVERWLNTNAA
jgi:hypothetical protein